MLTDVGQLVAKKYELIRLLGSGSTGEVWAAHHVTLGEKVALKLLKREPEDDVENRETTLARFLFEAQVAARLSRKTRHIVRVTDHGDEDGFAYIVMELLEGETLQQRLHREGPLPLETLRKIVAQIARALGQAHAEGVVHRDLKPANVFLTSDEDGGLLVKLLDFGIARAMPTHRVASAFSTARGLVFGTPGYMSPEQARASSRLDHRCDLWALATIAYEGLTGELPVLGADVEELLKNLCAGQLVPLRQRKPPYPESLSAFFDRGFALNMDDRYASAPELAASFEHAADGAEETVSWPTAFAETTGDVPRSGGGRVNVDRGVTRPQRARLALSAVAVLLGAAAIVAAWRAFAVPASMATPATSNTRPSMESAAPVLSAPRAVVPIQSPPSIPVSALPRAEPPSATTAAAWTKPNDAPSAQPTSHLPVENAHGMLPVMVPSRTVPISLPTSSSVPIDPVPTPPPPRNPTKAADKSQVF
jgi:serine/threonine protein kinase